MGYESLAQYHYTRDLVLARAGWPEPPQAGHRGALTVWGDDRTRRNEVDG